MSQNTVSVTGCAGFIGSHVTKQLLEKGYIVHGTVLPGEAHDFLAKIAAASPGELKIFHADLAEPDRFQEAFVGCTCVFHVAGPVGVWETDARAEIVNPHVDGTKVVLAACAAASVKKVVMTSSIVTVYNMFDIVEGKGNVYNENTWNPRTSDEDIHNSEMRVLAYDASKVLAEKAAWELASETLDLVTICPGLVFGPPVFGPGGFSIRTLANAIKNPGSEPVFVYGTLPAVDVRDVAKAHVAVAENRAAKGRYVVAHNHTFTQKDLSAILCDVCPELDCAQFDGPSGQLAFDNSKVVHLIGRLIDINTTIADTVRALTTSKLHGMNELTNVAT